MTHSDFILLARAIADESDAKGFKHTAKAMRETIDDLLSDNSHSSATRAANNDGVTHQSIPG